VAHPRFVAWRRYTSCLSGLSSSVGILRVDHGWLRHPADRRSLLLVTAYQLTLFGPLFVPELRNGLMLIAACGLSFLNAVVIHNVMHLPMFTSAKAEAALRAILSFGNLYPASANIPAHNRVHHRFEDDGLPDWAAPEHVRLPHPALSLLHFPNVIGPRTFEGVSRFARRSARAEFRRQYRFELGFAVGLTAALLAFDFWGALLFVLVPQLFGARWILRINLLQHAGTDPTSQWAHSRNFVGRLLNWLMMNNGYHTIHHAQPALHWSELQQAHQEQASPHVDHRWQELSLLAYLYRLCWRST